MKVSVWKLTNVHLTISSKYWPVALSQAVLHLTVGRTDTDSVMKTECHLPHLESEPVALLRQKWLKWSCLLHVSMYTYVCLYMCLCVCVHAHACMLACTVIMIWCLVVWSRPQPVATCCYSSIILVWFLKYFFISRTQLYGAAVLLSWFDVSCLTRITKLRHHTAMFWI